MLTVKFEEPVDSRKYAMVAIRGVGGCMLMASGLCKSQDHMHESVVRYGYDLASEWALSKRNDGWHVLNLDRLS